MRDRALMVGAVFLAIMGVMVDFASAILSMLGDAAMMGGAIALAGLSLRSSMSRIRSLEGQVRDMEKRLAGRSGWT